MNLGDGAHKDLCILRHLGSGAFGDVHKVCDNEGKTLALKTVVSRNSVQHKSAVQEIRCLSALQHINIVKVIAVDIQFDPQDTPNIYILLEFCSGGTLNTRLSLGTSYDTNLTWMVQIADAIRYLHGNSIVHRDLKPDNILLSYEDDIKVADFGLSRTFSGSGDDEKWIATYLEAYMGTLAGSPFWIAPEVFKKHYTEKADVFSLGVILYCIAERQYITLNQKRLYGAFASYQGRMLGIGQILHKSDKLEASKLLKFNITGATRTIKELLLETLECQPANRPTAEAVYSRISRIRRKYFTSRLNRSEDRITPTCW